MSTAKQIITNAQIDASAVLVAALKENLGRYHGSLFSSVRTRDWAAKIIVCGTDHSRPNSCPYDNSIFNPNFHQNQPI